MIPDQVLRGKLRKIEALFAGAATPGEKAAAGAAAERIRERLGQAAGTENFIEWKFSIPDIWSRQLFIALCRRYGLRPFRHPRMHRQTVMIKGPKSFIEQTLWPEFQELNAALVAYLSEITEKVIREEVHGETGVSRPAEFHRQPLSEPSVKLSPHWAPIRRTSRSYRVSSARRSPGTLQPAAREKAWPWSYDPSSS